jgi:3-hydroxybutyryl-CoA dehydrogenase
MTIESVAVLGGGLMGSGIAESVARAGLAVTVRDVDEAAVGAARGRVESSLDRALAGGKMDEAQRDEILARMTLTTEWGEIAEADARDPGGSRERGAEARILNEVADCVSESALIASNTSSIPIAQLAANIRPPERVLGLHFFSPVPVMNLVEVVVALDTSAETTAIATEFAGGIGKTAIETKDRSGFIVNMLLVPYLMAAVRMYEEGFATAEAITKACGSAAGARWAR